MVPGAGKANMILLEIPWPAKEVWPNYRQSHHWRSYEGPVKAQRELGKAVAERCHPTQADYEALAGLDKIAFNVEFYPPDRRHRDDDGMVGAIKSARDGIADGLNVNDRRFQATYRFMEPEKPGRVVIRIGKTVSTKEEGNENEQRCEHCGRGTAPTY